MNKYIGLGILQVKLLFGAEHRLAHLIIKGDVVGIQQKVVNGAAQ